MSGVNNIPLETKLASVNNQIFGFESTNTEVPSDLLIEKDLILDQIVARDEAARVALEAAAAAEALAAKEAYQDIPREIPSGNAYLPSFTTNQSGIVQQTDHARSTRKPKTKNTTGTISYSGVCSAHWGTNQVYNHFLNNGLFPEKFYNSTTVISAVSINNIKGLLNTLISGWTKGGLTQTYSNHRTFSSTNEKLTSNPIYTQATPDTTIVMPLWEDILTKLQIFDTAAAIGGGRASSGIDMPGTSTKITRSNYNNLIKSIEIISKACKCNSDCACNMVCNCNADCGCNY